MDEPVLNQPPQTSPVGQAHTWLWTAILILAGIVFAAIGLVLWSGYLSGVNIPGASAEQKKEWTEAVQKRNALEEANARAEAERAAGTNQQDQSAP